MMKIIILYLNLDELFLKKGPITLFFLFFFLILLYKLKNYKNPLKTLKNL